MHIHVQDSTCRGLREIIASIYMYSSNPPREWYHASALLLEPSFNQRVLSVLYDLSEVTFDLPLEGLELDEHWPSFAL